MSKGAVCRYCGRATSFDSDEMEKECECGDVVWNYQKEHIEKSTVFLQIEKEQEFERLQTEETKRFIYGGCGY